MNRQQNRTTLTYVILLWVVLAFLLESSDLLISINFYDPQSIWAKFLERFGEIPGIILILISIYIYFSGNKLSSNSKRIIFYFFMMLASTGLMIYMNYLIALYILQINFKVFNQVLFLILISSAINFTLLFLFRKIQKFSRTTLLFAKMTIGMALFGYALLVQPLKILWGRIRFRDLQGVYSDFTPWYLPNGITGNESFPSGHAAMGWILISLFILIMNKTLFKRFALKFLIVFWAVAVSVSRVVVGAHFASDVLFGGAIMIVTYLVLKNKLYSTEFKSK